MGRAIGILAHVDAGKTPLSEAILLAGGAIRRAGRVDQGTAALDADPVERARGITVYTAQSDFSFEGQDYTLIDTPGHVDFAAEALRPLSILDGALLLLDGTSRPGAHFAALYRKLAAANIPMLLVLTKADRPAFCQEAALAMVRARLGIPAIPLSCQGMAACQDSLAEALAEADDPFMEKYLAEDFCAQDMWDAAKRIFARGGALLAAPVSALTGQGIPELLSLLGRLLTQRRPAREPLEAPVYQVRVDEGGQRVCFVRVLAGELAVRDQILVQDQICKISEIRRWIGGRCQPAERIAAGDVAGLVGIPAQVGDVIVWEDGARRLLEGPAAPDFSASLGALIRPLDKAALPALARALSLMTLEEPLLAAAPQGQEGVHVWVAGPVQLEVVCQVLKSRFGIPAQAGPPGIRYSETVCAPVRGCGHYEPLRHYAEVQLALLPAPPGSGLFFQSLVSVDELALNWQRLIRSHVLSEGPHPGVLTGAPLTGVTVVLLGGRAHLKHTEGGDFRQATFRALRQAMMAARANGQMALLEPWVSFEITLPLPLAGRAMADMRRLSAQVEGQEPAGEGMCLLRGSGPLKTLMDYPLTLAQYAKGEGAMLTQPMPPQPCHDAQEVIQGTGYDPGADAEHPAWSVFCAHGAGYAVPWDQVPQSMHTLIPTQRLQQIGLPPG